MSPLTFASAMQELCATENRKAMIECGDRCSELQREGQLVFFLDFTLTQKRAFDSGGRLYISEHPVDIADSVCSAAK